jgi:hypothetical protein
MKRHRITNSVLQMCIPYQSTTKHFLTSIVSFRSRLPGRLRCCRMTSGLGNPCYHATATTVLAAAQSPPRRLCAFLACSRPDPPGVSDVHYTKLLSYSQRIQPPRLNEKSFLTTRLRDTDGSSRVQPPPSPAPRRCTVPYLAYLRINNTSYREAHDTTCSTSKISYLPLEPRPAISPRASYKLIQTVL